MINMTEAARRLGNRQDHAGEAWRTMGMCFVRPAPDIRRWVISEQDVDRYIGDLHT
jgi:hypothetical protein